MNCAWSNRDLGGLEHQTIGRIQNWTQKLCSSFALVICFLPFNFIIICSYANRNFSLSIFVAGDQICSLTYWQWMFILWAVEPFNWERLILLLEIHCVWVFMFVVLSTIRKNYQSFLVTGLRKCYHRNSFFPYIMFYKQVFFSVLCTMLGMGTII